jgi:hypothetical protein
VFTTPFCVVTKVKVREENEITNWVASRQNRKLTGWPAQQKNHLSSPLQKTKGILKSQSILHRQTDVDMLCAGERLRCSCMALVVLGRSS